MFPNHNQLMNHSHISLAGVFALGILSTLGSGGGGGSGGTANDVVTQIPVPDTGQLDSYTTTFGEDSDYIINPQSYTDNGDQTITDNVTSLVWQKQDDATARTWDDANAYCTNLTLDGTGWRLPSVFELMTIFDYSLALESINPIYFPGTRSGERFWSATQYSESSSRAWEVIFGYRVTSHSEKTIIGLVRCVRGEESLSVFYDNRNNMVTDRATNLIWQKLDDVTPKSWEQALTYCEGLDNGGFNDWRLPNIKELTSIVDFTVATPAINWSYFPNTQSAFYWTSTSYPSSSDRAFLVSFSWGASSSSQSFNKMTTHYSRCVRGG